MQLYLSAAMYYKVKTLLLLLGLEDVEKIKIDCVEKKKLKIAREKKSSSGRLLRRVIHSKHFQFS